MGAIEVLCKILEHIKVVFLYSISLKFDIDRFLYYKKQILQVYKYGLIISAMTTEKMKEQAVLFAALADPTRLKLLQILCHQSPPGWRCVNNLSELMGISQPAVSQHLRVLKSVSLVTGERRGFRMHYQIEPKGLKRCQRILSTTLEFNDSSKKKSCKQNCHSTKTVN